MTKKDIILKISDETNLKQIDVKKVVQKTFDYIIEALKRGEKIELRNFGVFKIKQRKRKYESSYRDWKKIGKLLHTLAETEKKTDEINSFNSKQKIIKE